MEKVKQVRRGSKPVVIPGQCRKKHRSILKNSVDSDFCATPDTGSPCSSRVGVRFNEDNIQSPDYFLYDVTRASGQTIISPLTVFQKIAAAKVCGGKTIKHDDTDSMNGEEGSDDDGDDDDVSTHDGQLPPLTLCANMSAEAQYAALKSYEEELHNRIAATFPSVSHRLDAVRSNSPDFTAHDVMDFEYESTAAKHPHEVSNRLKKAMDILDSVRESAGDEPSCSAGSCSNRTVAKDPVRSFEKWCSSLRLALDDLKVNRQACED